MMTIARIKSPGLRGPFDFGGFEMPSFDPLNLQPIGGFPLDAGSGNGGGGGGGGAPPAPPAGNGAPVNGAQPPLPGYYPRPTYLFPVQETPTAPTPEPSAAPSGGIPTWAIAAGAGLAGLVVGSILLTRGR